MHLNRSPILVLMLLLVTTAQAGKKQVQKEDDKSNVTAASPPPTYYLSDRDSMLYKEPLSLFDLKKSNILGTINEENDTFSILDPFFHIKVHEWNSALKTIPVQECQNFIKRQKYLPSLVELHGILSLYRNIKQHRGRALPPQYSELRRHMEACLRATQSLKPISNHSGLSVQYSSGQVSGVGNITFTYQSDRVAKVGEIKIQYAGSVSSIGDLEIERSHDLISRIGDEENLSIPVFNDQLNTISGFDLQSYYKRLEIVPSLIEVSDFLEIYISTKRANRKTENPVYLEVYRMVNECLFLSLLFQSRPEYMGRRVEYSFGLVNRIGNIQFDYNFSRIEKIGTVKIEYVGEEVSKIGNLKIDRFFEEIRAIGDESFPQERRIQTGR